MDSLHINGLNLATRIGVHDWEQRINQKLSVDIIIPADFSDCQDDISKTLDYDKLCQQVTNHIESNTFKLIETVAVSTALLIKETFQVKQVTVNVSKPHAVKNATNIMVSITR